MEPDPTLTRFFGRRFAAEVERATEEARAKFRTAPNHLDRDLPDRTWWVSVLLEEVGKLARACNKLGITPSSMERAEWNQEGKRRLRTIASMARRMAERWDELPDARYGTGHVGEV